MTQPATQKGPQQARAKQRALEALLVVRAQSGDAQAFQKLVELRGPRLFAHAARLLGERDGAHDVTQEAWVDIFRGLPRLKAPEAFLPWALRIVSRKVARDIGVRQKQRATSAALAPEFVDSSASSAGAGYDAVRVRAAIERLSPALRATVALFYLEDMSVAEVAVALDVPVGTVKTRLMHARKKLRAQFEGDHHG